MYFRALLLFCFIPFLSQSQSDPSPILITSGCDQDVEVSAQIFPDSIVFSRANAAGDSEKTRTLSGKSHQVADTLFRVLSGLGGPMVVRCPSAEGRTCRFEAKLKQSSLQCTNCSACGEDLDPISLNTLKRFKALLRDLNLFL